MKIAFLVRSAPPVIDGVGEYTYHLTHSLRQVGIDARIFTSTDQVAGKKIADWIHPTIPRWTGESVAEALTSIATFRPDLCCFQYVPQMYGRRGFCWEASNIPIALKQNLKCCVATTFHEFIQAWKPNPKDIVLTSVMYLQTRRLLAGCDLAITTCARYAKDLLTISTKPLPVMTIPVGANIPPVEISPQRLTELRARYALEGLKVFGVFGRLAPFRNYPTAVRTLAHAVRQGIKIRLMLIGCARSSNPTLFQELIQLAKKFGVEKQLVVTGDLSAEEVSNHLRLVDVFLFPLCDGLSTRNTTVMTAMAHGLPIIFYTPRPGNFEGYYIPHGCSVPMGDEEGFIHTAVSFLEKDLMRSSMDRQANVDYFQKNFSWSRIAEQYRVALAW